MRFAMKNDQICFSLLKFLAISPAIQKIATDCGCDAVVHLVQPQYPSCKRQPFVFLTTSCASFFPSFSPLPTVPWGFEGSPHREERRNFSMPDMTGRPGRGTMGMNGGSSSMYLVRTPCVRLFCTLFNGGGNRRAFRLPGEDGDHFHCTVEPSPGDIRCRISLKMAQKACHFHF